MHVARLRRRAYAPSTNAASHDNHEKISSWSSLFFFHMGIGLSLEAHRAAGAPP